MFQPDNAVADGDKSVQHLLLLLLLLLIPLFLAAKGHCPHSCFLFLLRFIVLAAVAVRATIFYGIFNLNLNPS